MKVKLLKKIRRQYAIERYDKISSNASDRFKKFKEKHGMPFFFAYRKDIDSAYSGGSELHTSFQDAKDAVLEDVLERFSEKFRHKPAKFEKVWYK